MRRRQSARESRNACGANSPGHRHHWGVKWVSTAIRFALFPVVILWPGGDWTWWEGWALVGVWITYAIGNVLYLRRHDPELLAERMKASPAQQDQKPWDKALMVPMMLAGIGLLIVPGLDVVRFGWSEPLPLTYQLIALVVHVPAMLWIAWVMKTNTFAARVVKIDEERGQTLIDTGPYAVVRHPMYTAVVLLFAATPIALGSRWGLVPAGAMIVLLLVRTYFEDRTLFEELEGYPQYTAQTRFRIIPGIW